MSLKSFSEKEYKEIISLLLEQEIILPLKLKDEFSNLKFKDDVAYYKRLKDNCVIRFQLNCNIENLNPTLYCVFFADLGIKMYLENLIIKKDNNDSLYSIDVAPIKIEDLFNSADSNFKEKLVWQLNILSKLIK